jgi:dipeptidyl aminopeptidase/acylaminoacyl peptidase
MRVHPHSNSQVEYRFYRNPYVLRPADGSIQKLSLPANAQFGIPIWSYDARFVALPRYNGTGVELWLADVQTGSARDLTGPVVNATLSEGYRQINKEHIVNVAWTPDNRHLLVPMILPDRGAAPQTPLLPSGPVVMETKSNYSRERNWEDLSRTPHDEALFEYYSTSQWYEIDVLSGERTAVGQPGLFIAPPLISPNGDFMLIQRVKRPYSYWVRYREFSRSIEIWDRHGRVIRVLADLPSRDHVEMGQKPRNLIEFQWQSNAPATLVWIEQSPEAAVEGQLADKSRLMRLSAPFTELPEVLAGSQASLERVVWLAQDNHALITEATGSRQWKKCTTWLADINMPAGAWRKLFEYTEGDMETDPGLPIVQYTARGERVLRQDGPWIYLSGTAGTAEGENPLLYKLNLENGDKTRLFESRPGSDEHFLAFIDDSGSEILISHESRLEPRGLQRVNLKTGEESVLIQPPNPYPQFQSISRQLVTYTRHDGVGLSGTLYLPRDYQPGDRLPLAIWAYPTEYADPRIASQVRVAPNRFMDLQFTTQQPFRQFATQGYAVLDMARMPVVGEPRSRNDTYIEQIVASAAAAIEYLDALGIIDPKRVGMGGHSYGGFSAANQLANSELFAAGIATSGSHNRTFDPWGFHAEHRTLWEAPEQYFKVSPLMNADRISAPLLLIHGEEDDSQSSKPIHSYRMFHALRGHGAVAKLVLLPLENHRYSARESRLHVAAEMIDWFDRYVKNKPQK